jgi:formamidopyrimidine-DNA glycosylase
MRSTVSKAQMPELPEVETVRRGLLPVMEGQVILNAQVNRPDLRWPFPVNMAARLTGAKVTALRRRSKYLLIDLSSDETLLVHLGMSGRMLISGQMLGEFVQNHPTAEKHDHVVFDMANGARITFNDARRFGAMDLFVTTKAQEHPLLANLGPEPFGNGFHQPYLRAKLAGRSTPIKTALLDQHVIAGLGNIYVCETLFRAGIAPTRLARDLKDHEVTAVVGIVKEVLAEAIEAGGASLKDYRQADGELGYFQHRFQAYGREGAPCVASGCSGHIERIVQSGRSTFHCPVCQR